MTDARPHTATQKPLCLYTVIVGFDDFTQGIEQFEASSPEAAMAMFLREAECLRDLEREHRETILERHIALLPVRKLDGVWLWLRAQSQVAKMKSVLGGQVIQTARSAPQRKAR
jgi:hypothetical protein